MSDLTSKLVRPAGGLTEKLGAARVPVDACYQCKKCSSGCPLTFAMDLLPDRVIRLALLGQEDTVLDCRTIWVCSSCETCTTRCPNNIDIARVMDWLKEEALRQGRDVPQPEVATFHRFFLHSILAGGGRLSETSLMRRFSLFKLRRNFDTEDLKANLKLGWELWKRGRLRLLGFRALRGKGEIKEIFKKSRA